jgi:hypothetical protein
MISRGWPNRISPAVLALADEAQYMHDRRDCHFVSEKRLTELCVRGASGVAPDFVLVGDSHADAISPSIFAAAAGANRAGYQFTDAGYRPAFGFSRLSDDEGRIQKLDLALGELLKRPNIREVFVMAYWASAIENQFVDASATQYSGLEALTRSLISLARTHPRIRFYFVEDNPGDPQLSPVVAARAIYFGKQPSVGITREAYQRQLESVGELWIKLGRLPNVRVVSIADYLCDRDFCQSTFEDKPLYRNEDHLSVVGAFRIEGLFRAMLRPPTATAKQQ